MYGKPQSSIVMRALPSGRQSCESAQGLQSSTLTEPSARVRFPCGQIVHSVLASSSFHVPTGQEVQATAPITILYFPCGQPMQASRAEAPVSLLHVPGGHRLHSVDPSPLHAPAPQVAHTVSLADGYPSPAGQLACNCNTEPSRERIARRTAQVAMS